MKNLLCVLLLLAAMIVPCAALGDGPLLLVELPDDAVCIENVEFEDGDFIQTYQLSGGSQVQLLRYSSFDMTLEELAESDWPDYTDAQALEIRHVGGCPAGGMCLTSGEGEDLGVTLVLVDAGAYTLIFSAVGPQGADAQALETMIETMDVLEIGSADAEVG